jgi:hypothetical protein
MVLSLAVVFAFVGVILAITLRQTPDPIRVIDATDVRGAVTSNAPYRSVAVLPSERSSELSGWRVTSARASAPGDTPFAWHIGYFTDTGTYAGVDQSNASAAVLRRDEQVSGANAGASKVGNVRWQRIEKPDGSRRWLLRTQSGVSTLIVGTGPWSQLEQLARSLKPV